MQPLHTNSFALCTACMYLCIIYLFKSKTIHEPNQTITLSCHCGIDIMHVGQHFSYGNQTGSTDIHYHRAVKRRWLGHVRRHRGQPPQHMVFIGRQQWQTKDMVPQLPKTSRRMLLARPPDGLLTAAPPMFNLDGWTYGTVTRIPSDARL